MDCKIFIEERNIISITGDSLQVEYHVKSGECFVISRVAIEKGLAVMKQAPQQGYLPDANKLANHQEGMCGTCGKWVIDCKCRRR